MRRMSAVVAGKTIRFLSQRAGHRGSSLPGNLALVLDPHLVSGLSSQVRGQVVVVTGTNGKTTTSNMISHVLADQQRSVVSNSEGANMIGGIATALLARSSIRGRLLADHAVLEADEGHFPAILRDTGAGVVVVTNFFRDQLDRYGELDMTIKTVSQAVREEKPHLVLNADDPLTFSLSTGQRPFLSFGIEGSERRHPPAHAREARFCPVCNEALEYSLYHYGQLGHYRCSRCAFQRPQPDVNAGQIQTRSDGIRCLVRTSRGEFWLDLPVPGLYNLHNALAAIAASLHLGVDPARAAGALASYRPATGRLQRFQDGDRIVYLNLVKNPTGFNGALGLLLSGEGTMDVILALNDNTADGRDVSWIYDADLELLADQEDRISQVICTGQRPEDMAIRLRYAGMSPRKILLVEDYRQAVSALLAGGADSAHVLATYTALWPLERILRRSMGRAIC